MSKATKPKHYVIAICIRILLPIIKIIPRCILFKIGTLLGYLIFKFASSERAKIIQNLNIGLPELNQHQRLNIAKKCFEHFITMVLDTLHCNPKKVSHLFHPDAIEKIKQVFNQYDGAIALTPHLGNWELGASAINHAGFNIRPIAKRIKMKPLNNIVENIRHKLGIHAIYQDQNIRQFIKVLKNKDLLGILPDQDIPRMNGVFVKFLAKEAYTPTGPVTLATLSKKPIIPLACILKGDKYDFIIGEPIHIDKQDKQKNNHYYTQLWSNTVSDFIRKYPEQWVWMHRRWRTQKDTNDNQT